MFNREIILPKATEVTNMVISHCNNIRSKISGAAIDSLKDLFRFLKKALIQNLEFGVKVRGVFYLQLYIEIRSPTGI